MKEITILRDDLQIGAYLLGINVPTDIELVIGRFQGGNPCFLAQAASGPY